MDPGDGEAHFLIAKSYKESGEFESMISHLDAADSSWSKGEEKVRELREQTWRKLLELGEREENNEKYEQARDYYTLAIAIFPERFEAYAKAGFVWQLLDNYDSTYFYYGEAYRLEPEKIGVLEGLAGLCYNMGKSARADSLYAKILEKDPENTAALLTRGAIAAENEDYTAAVDFYTRALDLESDNCDLWFRVGVVYFREMKNNEEAINAFLRAKELCPDDANPRINLNVVLLTMERFDEVIVNLETFTLDFPDECVGWDLYSQALLRNGMRKQALEAANKYEECKGAKQ
jgi:tetratricopeptide (TPR) repeat protein